MDVRVETGPLTAGAVLVETIAVVENISDCVIVSPIVSRFSLTPVISVGGNSISSITPELFRIGVMAGV